MNTSTRLIAAFASALALTACAANPNVPASQPHGVILMQVHHAADDTYPVAVTSINGVNLRTPEPIDIDRDPLRHERMMFRLPPGTHRIGLITDLTGTRHAFARETRNRIMPYAYEIELEVEEGKEYLLAGRQTGATLRDWEPFVKRVRDLR